MFFGFFAFERNSGFSSLDKEFLGFHKMERIKSESIDFGWNSRCNSFPIDSYFDKSTESFVVFHGEIYNKKNILPEFAFNKLSDAEFIFRLIHEKGLLITDSINGDFVFLYYDATKKVVNFVKDHIGNIPLSLSFLNNKIYFSTNPLHLCGLSKENKVSEEYLINKFLWEGFDHDMLPNKKVFNVPAGNILRIENNLQISKIQYWHPEIIRTDYSLTQEQVVSDLKDLLEDAVKIRCSLSLKYAAHVSGGLDSGVISALGRKFLSNQEEFFGFSWTPLKNDKIDDIDFDERETIKAHCRKNNIQPWFIDFGVLDALKQIENWESPSEHIFENQVMSVAKENDVKVILSGWGGDEFISIGHRGIDSDLIRNFHWKSFFKKYPIKYPKRLASALLFNALFPSFKRQYSKYKTHPSIYPYLKKGIKSNLIPKSKRIKYSSRRMVHLQLLKLGHLSKRINDWYIEGEKYGITYRFPLLDKRIIEYMIKTPSNCLVGENNYRILLRIIGKDLLAEEILRNNSKDDPVKSFYLNNIYTDLFEILLKDFEAFRNCAYFKFIDFDLIQKDIDVYKKTRNLNLEERLSFILWPLKSSYEFIKDYLK